MAKAILDYVLRSPVEQQRLDLEPLAPLLAAAQASSTSKLIGNGLAAQRQVPSAAAVLPTEWHQHVGLARDGICWGLQTLSPNALELMRLWHDSGYAAVRLLDVASRELLERLPVRVSSSRQLGLLLDRSYATSTLACLAACHIRAACCCLL